MFYEKYTVAATIAVSDESNEGRPTFIAWAIPKRDSSGDVDSSMQDKTIMVRMAILSDGDKHLTFHAPDGAVIADYPNSDAIDDDLSRAVNDAWDGGGDYNLSGRLATVMAALAKSYETASAVAPILGLPVMQVMMMLASALPGVAEVSPVNRTHHTQHEETKQ